jgi:hypothetical protein
MAHVSFCLRSNVATHPFGLAFALLWTPVARRAAAMVLALMMGAAVYEFGSMDALGHLLIIVILIATLTEGAHDREGAQSTMHSMMLAPLAKGVALGAVFFGYYVAHYVFYGAQSPRSPGKVASTLGQEEALHQSHASGLRISAVSRPVQP